MTVLLYALSVVPMAIGVWMIRISRRMTPPQPLGMAKGIMWIVLGVTIDVSLAGAHQVATIGLMVVVAGLLFLNSLKILELRRQRRAG